MNSPTVVEMPDSIKLFLFTHFAPYAYICNEVRSSALGTFLSIFCLFLGGSFWGWQSKIPSSLECLIHIMEAFRTNGICGTPPLLKKASPLIPQATCPKKPQRRTSFAEHELELFRISMFLSRFLPVIPRPTILKIGYAIWLWHQKWIDTVQSSLLIFLRRSE